MQNITENPSGKTNEGSANRVEVSKRANEIALKQITQHIAFAKDQGSVVLIIGAWVVGKSFLGKLIAQSTESEYLDGDDHKIYHSHRIKRTLEGIVDRGSSTVIGASYAEKWATEEQIQELKQKGCLIIVNLTADN